MTTFRRPLQSTLVALVALVLALLGPVGAGGVASAHTGFDSSVPADGDSVDQPVDVVTISFTGSSTPIDDGFVALDGDGTVRAPNAVDWDDSGDLQVYSLRFDPPLSGGDVGIRWSVLASDGHPREGAFAFAVTASLPPVTTQPTTATAPETTTPGTAAPPASAPAATDTPAESAPADTTATNDSAASPSTVPAIVAGDQGDDASGEAAAPVSLDEFLAVDDEQPGETTALVGRVISLLAVAVSLGALAFAASALRGPRREAAALLRAVMVAAGVLVVGAAIEYVGVSRLIDESIGSAWSTSAGAATLLRLGGALAIVAGLVLTLRRGEFQSLTPTRALSAAVIDDVAKAGPAVDTDRGSRWRPTAQAWPLALGVALVLASFWFDGHTVSKGIRPIHAAVNTVHVAAGSIWVGGVVALCATLLARRRAGRERGTAELVVRFSHVATVALAAVVVAGAAMAVVVLDSFADLTGTEWGQTLLLKNAAVAVAIAAGAYNHFRLVPALDADPDSPELTARVRSTLVAESVILLFVVVVTAWLVAASTV